MLIPPPLPLPPFPSFHPLAYERRPAAPSLMSPPSRSAPEIMKPKYVYTAILRQRVSLCVDRHLLQQ